MNVTFNASDTSNTTLSGICATDTVIMWYVCVMQEYAPLGVYVDRFVSPFWYILGLVGNSIAFCVWTKRYNRHANVSSLYLAILAVTDNLLLLSHTIIELQYAWGVSVIDHYPFCSIYFVVYYALQYASPLLILGFTIERFISITHPFRSERFSRNQRGPIEIFVLSIIAIALGVPQYFGWEIDPNKNNCDGSNSDFYTVWSMVSDVLVFVVFPVTTLILNILVLRAAAVSVKFRRQPEPSYHATPTTSVRTKQRQTRASPSTATLLTVSFYRLLTLIPVGIIFILQFSYPLGNMDISVEEMGTDGKWRKHFNWYIAKKIIDEIGLSQYSCNFFIYLVTAKPFRVELKHCLGLLREKGPQNVPLTTSFHHASCHQTISAASVLETLPLKENSLWSLSRNIA